MNQIRNVAVAVTIFVAAGSLCAAGNLRSDATPWPPNVCRPQIGPDFWANPLMDWRLIDGRIECHTSGLNHDVHWMTHELKPEDGTRTTIVDLGLSPESSGEAFNGYKFGVTGHTPVSFQTKSL